MRMHSLWKITENYNDHNLCGFIHKLDQTVPLKMSRGCGICDINLMVLSGTDTIDWLLITMLRKWQGLCFMPTVNYDNVNWYLRLSWTVHLLI
jgi:hypothetical protein